MARVTGGRLAGLIYLIVVLTGLFSLAYAPGRLFVPGDAAATLRAIADHEALFRGMIASAIVCYLAFLLLPLQLFGLLAPAAPRAARMMVALAVVSVPMALLNLVHLLRLLDGVDAATATAELAAYRHGLLLVQLFWGLWLAPLGWIVVRTDAIPRILGLLLMFACAAYLIRVFGTVLIADFRSLPGVGLLALPGTFGEIGTCLWLLIFGSRPVAADRSLDPPAPSP